MSREKRAVILLAAYNGEKYIGAQIDSILNQSFKDFDLIIRDDYSDDHTMEILKQRESLDKRISILQNKTEEHGQLKNFEFLMNLEKVKNYDYIFFSDQDDVWNVDKLAVSLNCLQKMESKYRMVYTNYSVFGSGKERIRYNDETYFLKNLHGLLVQNWIMGCTMGINQNLNKIAKSIPKSADNHDNWIANLAALIGAVEYISNVTMNHRIHNNNVTQNIKTKTLRARALRICSLIKNKKIIQRKKVDFCKALLKSSIGKAVNVSQEKTLMEMLLMMKHRTLLNIFKMIKFRILGVNRIQSFIIYILLFA